MASLLVRYALFSSSSSGFSSILFGTRQPDRFSFYYDYYYSSLTENVSMNLIRKKVEMLFLCVCVCVTVIKKKEKKSEKQIGKRI